MDFVLGTSVSLSSNGSILSVGGPYDGVSVGAAWIFKHDGSTYHQVGSKLIGQDISGPYSRQGKGKNHTSCLVFIHY